MNEAKVEGVHTGYVVNIISSVSPETILNDDFVLPGT